MIDAAIAKIAATQWGNVTRSQLLALGLSASQIHYRLRYGRLHRLYRGLCGGLSAHRSDPVGGSSRDGLRRAGDAQSRIGDDALGALEVVGPTVRRDRCWRRRLRDVRIHRVTGLLKRDVRIRKGIQATSPARTILDQAPSISHKSLTRAVNNARVDRILTLDDLADVTGRFPFHPGAPPLRPFIDVKDGPTRSEWEDAFQPGVMNTDSRRQSWARSSPARKSTHFFRKRR